MSTGRRPPDVIPLTTVDERYLTSKVAWEALRPTATVIVSQPARTADGAVDLEPVRRLALRLVNNHPRLRQRMRFAPLGLHAPAWTWDQHFDLDWHVRRHPVIVDVDAIPPRVLAGFENGPMSRRRPTWDFLATELSNGDLLLTMRVHHVATDGLVGREMLLGLLGGDEEFRPDTPSATNPAVHDTPRTPIGVAHGVFRHFLTQSGETSALPALREAMGATPLPERLRRVAGRNIRPLRNLAARFAGGVQASQYQPRLVSMPISPLRQFARRHGGSLSDMTTAALAAGLAAAGRENVDRQRPVRIMVPMSLRRVHGAAQINRVKIVVVTLPRTADLGVLVAESARQMSGGAEEMGPTTKRAGGWEAYSTYLPGPPRHVSMMARQVRSMMLWPAMDPRERCAALSLSAADQLSIALMAGPGVDADGLAGAIRSALVEQLGVAG